MRNFLAILVVVSGLSAPAPAAAFEAVDSMAAVEMRIEELGREYGAEKVLAVFDIDNTLLTLDQDLGGEAWFRWQISLLNANAPHELRVAKDFAGLLEAQGVIYSLSMMKPTEPMVPPFLDRLEAKGFRVIALTARGPQLRDSTLRQLNDEEIRFDTPVRCGPPLCATRGRIAGDQVLAAAKTALTAEQIATFGLDKPREISVSEGVMMVAGQHKGAMLRLLLASAPDPSFKAIVFTDDGLDNVENMEAAFAGSDIDLAAFYYVRLQADVAEFLEDPARQQATDRSWDRLSALLCAEFKRWCAP
jgi:hypothetical protein